MVRVHHWILIAAIAGLIGCSSDSDEPAPTQAQQAGHDYPENNWRIRYLELGRETYVKACASCHEANDTGAPVTGDSESWAGRSPFWSAVLLEHAKSGYLGMPGKGGQAGLSDRAVEAAGEYMLHKTFPDLPEG